MERIEERRERGSAALPPRLPLVLRLVLYLYGKLWGPRAFDLEGWELEELAIHMEVLGSFVDECEQKILGLKALRDAKETSVGAQVVEECDNQPEFWPR